MVFERKSKQKWEKEKNNTKEKRKSRKGGRGEGASPSPKNPTGSSARALLVSKLLQRQPDPKRNPLKTTDHYD